MISAKLIQAILRQYRLALRGTHGPVHWGRVLENGSRLADSTGANPAVVQLFAVFHDACRLNEDDDPQHGQRGAKLVESLRGRFLDLSDDDFARLKTACELHHAGLTDGEVTVQTCWDADRLDLGRVGIKPQPRRLCTQAARNPEMIEWAHERARRNVIPDIVEQWLAPAKGKA